MQVTAGSISEPSASIIDQPKQVCSSQRTTLLGAYTAILRSAPKYNALGCATVRCSIACVNHSGSTVIVWICAVNAHHTAATAVL
jgi:hypothetical protein